MKVLLAPYYFYLHYESFRRVSASLNSSEIDSAILHMPCNAVDENHKFGPERLQADACRFVELPLFDLGWKGPSVVARLSRLPSLLINRQRIRDFLRVERPSLVVVGSDLGGLYIRLLLSGCMEAGIRTMILATSASGPPATDSKGSRPLTWHFARKNLHLLTLSRVVFFNSWRIGSFDTEAPIAVPGKALKEELIDLGVSEDRVFITGDPAHDAIYELAQRSAVEIRSEICSLFGWSTDVRIIVYCTEVIHEILGEAYLERVNKLLADAFAKLPQDCKVIVKLHPRETPQTEARFSDTFLGERYAVSRDLDLHRLIRSAALCIGHYSRALVDSVLLGTPIACINLVKDENRVLLDARLGETRIESESDFVPKIRRLLDDQEIRGLVDAKLAAWRSEYATAIDGRSSERTANLICKVLEGFPA